MDCIATTTNVHGITKYSPPRCDDGKQLNMTTTSSSDSHPCQKTSTQNPPMLLKPRFDPLHNGRPHLAYLLSPALDEYYHKHSETKKSESYCKFIDLELSQMTRHIR